MFLRNDFSYKICVKRMLLYSHFKAIIKNIISSKIYNIDCFILQSRIRYFCALLKSAMQLFPLFLSFFLLLTAPLRHMLHLLFYTRFFHKTSMLNLLNPI